jgi:hypothetical protein
VISSGESYEVDPNKLSPGEDPEANLKKLSAISQAFLDSVLKSKDKLP